MTFAPTGGASGATQMFQTSKIKIIISISLDMKVPNPPNLTFKGHQQQQKGHFDDL